MIFGRFFDLAISPEMRQILRRVWRVPRVSGGGAEGTAVEAEKVPGQRAHYAVGGRWFESIPPD
jgi:hypothetical protein